MKTSIILLCFFLGAYAHEGINFTSDARKTHHAFQTVEEINHRAKVLWDGTLGYAIKYNNSELIKQYLTEDCRVKHCGQVKKECFEIINKWIYYTDPQNPDVIKIDVAIETDDKEFIRLTVSNEVDNYAYQIEFTWEKKKNQFSFIRFFEC
ncbi:unnamed protein product [Caenorhabditis brenneri]